MSSKALLDASTQRRNSEFVSAVCTQLDHPHTDGILSSLVRPRASLWAQLTNSRDQPTLYLGASEYVRAVDKLPELQTLLKDDAESKRMYTVFVPNNDALVDKRVLDDQMNMVLRSHIVPGDLALTQIPVAVLDKKTQLPVAGVPGKTTQFRTVADTTLQIKQVPKTLWQRSLLKRPQLNMNGQIVSIIDTVLARNGRIYLIDAVVPYKSRTGPTSNGGSSNYDRIPIFQQ